ncbi:hypothetical protein I302_105109 [Kwoniella bestiolae CBS 10118]|uniref:Uncharacterized protein n=1 Tax=Kwoniella bestiolae CBS 10118 TaxID=1296100 RepID=A0A1B9FS76_9TREE|nr:hypothetical protein I302_08396 [Kwoniella bestiolae CBS 10118]OCF21621.1 hypothetical protein I302_08396 [Kwoniella bestiolae CBS 10118]
MSTSYYHTHNSPTPTIHHLIQSRANAISSIPFSQTSTTFIDIVHSPCISPLIPPRGMVEVSPTASSPSLYSRVGHSNSPQQQMLKTSRKLQVMSVSDHDRRTSTSTSYLPEDVEQEEEEDDDPRRMSMVGGPRVRKYTQVPWEEDENEWSMVPPSSNRGSNGGTVTVVGSADMFSGFGKHNKSTNPYSQVSKSGMKSGIGNGREREQSTISTTSTILSQSDSSSLNVSSTRRGLAQILGVSSTSNSTQNGMTKHLVPSASGLSLASNQTSSSSTSTASSLSDAAPITPKLKSTIIPSNAVQIQVGNSPTYTITTNLKKEGRSRKVETFHQNQHQSEFDTNLVGVGLLSAVIPKPTSTTYKKPTNTNEALSPSPNSTSNPDGFTANDRPLMSSGSPGFGLISLEAAQERERMKSQNSSSVSSQPQPHHTHNTSKSISDPSKRPLTTFSIPPIPDEPINTLRPTTSCTSTSTPSSPPSGTGREGNKVKSKKSGLMRLFNKSDKDRSNPVPIPPLPLATGMGSTTPTSKSREGGGAISIWSTSDNYPTTQTQTVHGESAVWPRPSSANPNRKNHGIPLHAADDDVSAREEEKDKLGVGVQPKLELRPVSMTFSRGLPVDYLVAPAGTVGTNSNISTREGTVCDVETVPPIPLTPASILKEKPVPSDDGTVGSVPDEMNRRINNAKKAFKIQIYELEAQIRELKDELRDARARKVLEGNCDKCGCTCNSTAVDQTSSDGLLSVSNTGTGGGGRRVIDRARVKTAGARGVFGSGSLYEWE